MTDCTPTPELVDRASSLAAAHAADGLPRDAAVPNLVVAGDPEMAGTTPKADGYEGPAAATAAHLAAVLRALDEGDAPACLHYPEPDGSANGPWLVLEPLGGRISTVHAGRGRVRVSVAADTSLPDALRGLLDAAEPHHEYYPVDADELGVFTTGMETVTLRRVDAVGSDDRPTVAFDVSVTPTTTAADVESRFETVDGVASATFEVVTGVERARPPDPLRAALEAAHVDELGDCEYEWRPEPTVFSHLPEPEKAAFGPAPPGAETVDGGTVADCVSLLSGTLAGWAEAVAAESDDTPKVDR